jgi:hypothetical protein
MRQFLAMFFAIVCSCAAVTELVTIPLKSIWALDMPGSRDVRALESDRAHSLVDAIKVALSSDASPELKALKRGFAVAGAGRNALAVTSDILTGKVRPTYKFAEDAELTIVFFSREFGSNVEIQQVAKQGTTFTIKYRFVPHKSDDSTEHFALIPVGKLATGNYRVSVVYSGSEPARKQVVCESFEFAVGAEKVSGRLCRKPSAPQNHDVVGESQQAKVAAAAVVRSAVHAELRWTAAPSRQFPWPLGQTGEAMPPKA